MSRNALFVFTYLQKITIKKQSNDEDFQNDWNGPRGCGAQPTENAITATFRKFPFLNVSEVARSLGMHKSLLSKYIYGTKKPSAKREKEILDALRELGRQLANI